MIPLRDVIPSRTTPYITVTIIVLNALAWFLDRKAAAFVYNLRLHTVTLFVFRAEGLPWPSTGWERAGERDVYRDGARGFTVVMWRAHGLGYALVSDADPREVLDLAARFGGA